MASISVKLQQLVTFQPLLLRSTQSLESRQVIRGSFFGNYILISFFGLLFAGRDLLLRRQVCCHVAKLGLKTLWRSYLLHLYDRMFKRVLKCHVLQNVAILWCMYVFHVRKKNTPHPVTKVSAIANEFKTWKQTHPCS